MHCKYFINLSEDLSYYFFPSINRFRNIEVMEYNFFIDHFKNVSNFAFSFRSKFLKKCGTNKYKWSKNFKFCGIKFCEKVSNLHELMGYSIWSPHRGTDKVFRKKFALPKYYPTPCKLTYPLEDDLNSNYPFSLIFKLTLEECWDLKNTPWKTDHLLPLESLSIPLYGLQME